MKTMTNDKQQIRDAWVRKHSCGGPTHETAEEKWITVFYVDEVEKHGAWDDLESSIIPCDEGWKIIWFHDEPPHHMEDVLMWWTGGDSHNGWAEPMTEEGAYRNNWNYLLSPSGHVFYDKEVFENIDAAYKHYKEEKERSAQIKWVRERVYSESSGRWFTAMRMQDKAKE